MKLDTVADSDSQLALALLASVACPEQAPTQLATALTAVAGKPELLATPISASCPPAVVLLAQMVQANDWPDHPLWPTLETQAPAISDHLASIRSAVNSGVHDSWSKALGALNGHRQKRATAGAEAAIAAVFGPVAGEPAAPVVGKQRGLARSL